MQRVYTAGTLIEAHLIQQMLKAESIKALVFNENAQGALGELPTTETWPEVWIEDNSCEQLARSIIKHYDSSTSSEMCRRCEQCEEENPSNFELCWSCGVNLD